VYYANPTDIFWRFLGVKSRLLSWLKSRKPDLYFWDCTNDATGGVFAPGDAYAQAKRCFEIIQQALQDLDADLSNVVRTRMFVTEWNQQC
jgi:Endoribonuclease L-PSP